MKRARHTSGSFIVIAEFVKGTWQINISIQGIGKLNGPYATDYFDNEPTSNLTGNGLI